MTPFPLPKDPQFRREIIRIWLEDFDDHIDKDPKTAKESYLIGRKLYLALPAGEGDPELETLIDEARVKIEKLNNS